MRCKPMRLLMAGNIAFFQANKKGEKKAWSRLNALLAAANLFSLFLTAYFQLLVFKDLMLFEYYVF